VTTVFASARPDGSLLARVAFGDAWLALVDPSDGGVCDPDDVRHRLAMYRLLVERCNASGGFGTHDELSPFWGYVSQLAWQHASGRLGDPATQAIEPTSWWGACNYALCIVPYVAAAKLGVVPALRFAEPPRDYAPAIDEWRAAITAMCGIRNGATARDHDRVRIATWHAHLTSISIAVAMHRLEHARMPTLEQRFARGWIRMVDTFGAAGLRTDLVRLAHERSALPSRILISDAALAELPRGERATALRVCALADRPAWRWRLELLAWQRMMRSFAARGDVDPLLAVMVGRGGWSQRARALAYATLPSGLLDRLARLD
jgi:hypothetical protein